MKALRYVKSRISTGIAALDEKGQATSEYVLLILGVVFFLVVASMGLRGALNSAIAAISTWISQSSPPPV